MRFVKRPVVVDAVQWAGDNLGEVFDELGLDSVPLRSIYPSQLSGMLYIRTLEGRMCAQKGDWIIRGVRGELYPCEPDIFHETYEPAIEGATDG